MPKQCRPKECGRRRIVMPKPAEDMIVGNLIGALERLRQDLDRAELWAAALGYFQAPIPEYEPSDRYVLPCATGGSQPAQPRH